MRPSTRRELIAAGAATAAAAAVPPAWGKRLLSSRASVGPGAFLDGVASGDPGPRGISFWSRVDGSRPRTGARLIVARDQGLRRVVATAVVPTGRGINGTLKVRIGGLRPSTEYFYGWESTNDHSPVGRTRTLPDPRSNRTLRIAFSSCQNYPAGYFSAHAHAATQDVDLCVFLGDYIYERPRRLSPPEPRSDTINSNDLRSYRDKYRLYRSDAGLRELHRVHPAVHIWDDHEVANNYSDNNPAPSPLQRTAGYRAAFEWLPRQAIASDRYKIYKRIALGRVADLFLLDERQYRTGDGDGQPRRILDDVQMQWLIAGLRGSRARWKIIAQQVVVAPMVYGSAPRLDAWSGYPEQRAHLLGEIQRGGIDNVVFLSGDEHVFMVNVLGPDASAFSDPAVRAAAVEYVGGSVTSPATYRDPAEVLAHNPWTKQFDSVSHGYAHITADGAEMVTEYRHSDVSRRDGATVPFERFVQAAGSNAPARDASLPPS